MAAWRSGHTTSKKQIHQFKVVFHIQESTHTRWWSPPHQWLSPVSGSHSSTGAAQPSCDSRRTPQRASCLARDACLVGENPACSVQAIYGCEGLWSCTTTAMHAWVMRRHLPRHPPPHPKRVPLLLAVIGHLVSPGHAYDTKKRFRFSTIFPSFSCFYGGARTICALQLIPRLPWHV